MKYMTKSVKIALSIAGIAFVGGGIGYVATAQSPTPTHQAQPKTITKHSSSKVSSESHSKSSSTKQNTSSSVAAPSASTSLNVEPSATTTTTSISSSAPEVAATTASSVTQSSQVTPSVTPKSAPTTPQVKAPVNTDTSGFNFGNYHFPIAPFSGTGQVPADNNVYQWTSDSRWFLIEQGGNAGHVIKANVGIGSTVIINHITYHVTDMKSGLLNSPTNSQGHDYYKSHINQHAVGFQTCDSVGVLTEWFAD